MNSRDHERFRRQLEKQLRADVELIYGAYCAKLRAYEVMHQLHGDLDSRLLPAAELPLSLPPAALPATPPPAPAPAPPPRKAPHELYLAVRETLEELPELFDRSHVNAALGFEPRRPSLYRVLRDLEREGWIAVEERGEGKLSNLYRKLPPPDPPADSDAD
jgi:hypothetical protein